jgi:CMP-N,N'-diacetyllegionaminic acid synthase
MKKLVIIPARDGSKRLPNKNLKILNGKPLIIHSVEIARKIFNDNEICVSTDSSEIKSIVEKSGLRVPFLRPKELAQDNTPTEEVLIHALKWYDKNNYKPDVIILLQPTSPFRKKDDINNAIKKFTFEIDMVASVKSSKNNPYFNLYEENENGHLEKSKSSNIYRSQDCPKVWEINGSIYIINVAKLHKKGFSNFNKIVKYVIDNPIYSLDIDTEYDWLIANAIINHKNENS